MVFHVMNSTTHMFPAGNARLFGSAPNDLHARDLDEESIRLAISLQLEDIRNTHDVSTQLGEDDEVAVFGKYRRYLEDAERLFADRKFAETLAAGSESPQLTGVDELHWFESRTARSPVVDPSPSDSPRSLEPVVDPPPSDSPCCVLDNVVFPEHNDVDLDMIDMFEEEIQLACAVSLEMYKAEQENAEEDEVCTWSEP